MWETSKEKRALAMKLSIKMIQIVPPDAILTILSPTMISSLFSSRAKKNNLLYDYVGSILDELVLSVNGHNDRILALITALTENGGGSNFDSRTNSNTISSLVKAMDSKTISQYFQLLCSFLGKAEQLPEQVESKMDTDEEDSDNAGDEPQTKEQHTFTGASVDTLQSMISLSKHAITSDSNDLLLSTTAILLRIAAFNEGNTVDSSSSASSSSNNDASKKKEDSKKDKKKKSKGTEEPSIVVVNRNEAVETSIQAIQAIEKSFENGFKSSEELKQFAKDHFMNFLSHCLGKLTTSVHQEKKGGNKGISESTSSGDALLLFLKNLWIIIGHFFTSKLVLTSKEGEEEKSIEQVYSQTNEAIQYLSSFTSSSIATSSSAFNEKKSTVLKYCENAISFLLTIFCSQLLGNEIDSEVLLSLPSLIQQFLPYSLDIKKEEKPSSSSSKKSKKVVEEEDDEEEEEPLEVRFLDVCIDLFSMNNNNESSSSSSSSSLKGLREIIKRLWNNIFVLMDEERISQSFFDLLIESAVEFDDHMEEDEINHHDQGMEGEEEDSEEEAEDDADEDEEEEEEDNAKGKKRKQSLSGKDNGKKKMKSDKNNKNKKQDEDVEDEEEDIVIKEEDMLDLLLTEEDGDDLLAKMKEGKLGGVHQHGDDDDDDDEMEEEEKGELLHFADADEALIKMMKLRQENRKKGILSMKRIQCLLKSRVLDILEVFIHRSKSGNILFSFLYPLLKGYQSAISSNLLQELQEGKAYCQRLYSLIINEFCKKKIVLKLDVKEASKGEGEEGEEEEVTSVEELQMEFIDEIKELLFLHQKLLISKNTSLKTLSSESFYFLLKLILQNTSSVVSSILPEEKKNDLYETIMKFVCHLLEKYYYSKNSNHSSTQKLQLSSRFLEELLLNRFSSFFLFYRNIREVVTITKEETEEEESSKNKKKEKKNSKSKKTTTTPVLSSPSSLSFIVMNHLNEGIKKCHFFSKKLQLIELINTILQKQLIGSNNGNHTKKNNNDSIILSKNHSTSEEFLSFLRNDFLQLFIRNYSETAQVVVDFAEEKHSVSASASSSSSSSAEKMKGNKKEYDTKNIRQFMSLLKSLLLLIEQISTSTGHHIICVLENLTDLNKLLTVLEHLNTVYEQASSSSSSSSAVAASSTSKEGKKGSSSSSKSSSSISPVLMEAIKENIAFIHQLKEETKEEVMEVEAVVPLNEEEKIEDQEKNDKKEKKSKSSSDKKKKSKN
jgi:hypothetical protein